MTIGIKSRSRINRDNISAMATSSSVLSPSKSSFRRFDSDDLNNDSSDDDVAIIKGTKSSISVSNFLVNDSDDDVVILKPAVFPIKNFVNDVVIMKPTVFPIKNFVKKHPIHKNDPIVKKLCL